MKLIIDIPEDALKEMRTEEFISIESLDIAIECIKNGTPLDDVKAEINKAYEDVTMYSCDEQVSCFASRVSEILNNIGKESEE